LHNNFQKGIMQEFLAIHNRLVEALEKDDSEAIYGLAKEHDECVKRLLDSGAITNSQDYQTDYQTFVDLKKAVDQTCNALEQKKARVFSQIVALKKRRQCVSAYKKNKF
jgi:hypothetical protein